MIALYEKTRENIETPIRLNQKNFEIVAHYHAGVELFLVFKGSYELYIDGIKYIVKDNEIVLFSPFVIHEYRKELVKNSHCKGVLIPYEYAESFYLRHKGQKILCPIINDGELCDKIYSLFSYFDNSSSKQVLTSTSNLIFSLLEQKLTFSDSNDNHEGTLLKNILSYIHKNYKSNISATAIAHYFGYSPEHISRVFHGSFGRSIPQYINELRLDYIENNIENYKGNKTNIIYDAGFNSLQTYYRNKKNLSKK